MEVKPALVALTRIASFILPWKNKFLKQYRHAKSGERFSHLPAPCHKIFSWGTKSLNAPTPRYASRGFFLNTDELKV
jgi:hypothetical protein